MNLAKKLMGRLTKFNETYGKSSVNEEYPSELKGLHGPSMKKLGDKLSSLGFDVQRTNFGDPVPNLSNRDPRLKSADYVVFIYGALPSRYSNSSIKQLYVLYNGKLIEGDQQNFSDASWTTIINKSIIWVISKAESTSTKELRSARAEAKDGALALTLEKARKEYESNIADHKKTIVELEKELSKAEPGSGYWNADGVKERLDRNINYFNDFLSSRDKMGTRGGLEKYRKQLAAIKLAEKTNEFDDEIKSGGLFDQMQEYMDIRVKMQMEYFKEIRSIIDMGPKSKYSWSSGGNSRPLDILNRQVTDMMRIMERWISNGYISDADKKELLAELKAPVPEIKY